MTTTMLTTPLDLPCPVTVRPAGPGDVDALTHLWQLFRHHMSTTNGALPGPDGRYRSERLDRALDAGDPGSRAWLVTAADRPVGLAVARALDEPVRVLTAFFLVAPARGGGLGRAVVTAVLSSLPGRWSVAYQESNRPAAAFWQVVAAAHDVGYRQESREVGRGEPDVWLTFTVAGAQRG